LAGTGPEMKMEMKMKMKIGEARGRFGPQK